MSRKPVLKKLLTLISLGFLLALTLMAVVLPRRPARADEGTPFKATLPVQFTASQFCAPGDTSCQACTNPSQNGLYVEAQGLADTSLGPQFAQVLKCFYPNNPPFGTYAGTLTTTAPNGKDSLTWTYSGKNDNGGDFYGFQPFSGTLTITSGTGKFAGARGVQALQQRARLHSRQGPVPSNSQGQHFIMSRDNSN